MEMLQIVLQLGELFLFLQVEMMYLQKSLHNSTYSHGRTVTWYMEL